MSILQSYEIRPSNYQKQSFVHYKNKPAFYGYNLDPNRTITFNYIDPNTSLVGSDVEAKLFALIASERQFVVTASITGSPVAVSIDKAPRAPLTWSVTYLYPNDVFETYLEDEFIENEVDLIKETDTYGILSWSIRASVSYEPYMRPYDNGSAIVQRIDGYIYSDALFTIDATVDYEIPSPWLASSVLVQGLDFNIGEDILNINENTLKYSVSKSEDTSLRAFYRYSWEFGIN